MFALARLDTLLPPGVEPADRVREIDILNENRLTEDAAEHHKLTIFKKSVASQKYMNFVLQLNASVANVKVSMVDTSSRPSILSILSFLDAINSIVDAVPPFATQSRFGNPAFREFLGQLATQAPSLTRDMLSRISPDLATAPGFVEQLCAYLNDCFGNIRRLDYGTGHELNFVCWMYCLCADVPGVIAASDHPAMVWLFCLILSLSE